MAIVDVPVFPLWNLIPASGGTFATAVIDASGEKVAFILQAPKSGTIDRVCFRTATVTTGQTVDVRVETVGADGYPTGALWGTNTNGAQVIASADDNVWFEKTLTAGATVTKGDVFAIVISLSGAGNMQIAYWSPIHTAARPYGAHFTASWAKLAGAPVCAVRYNNESYGHLMGVYPWTAATNSQWSDSTNPDERGNKITVPMACRVVGAWMNAASVLGDFTIKLYDSGLSLLESIDVDGDHTGGVAIVGDYKVMFGTSVTLAAGASVFLTKRVTTATQSNLFEYTVPAGLQADGGTPGGGRMLYATRNNDAGAFTEDATRLAHIGLLVDGLDDGAGGSGSGACAFSFVG